MKIAYFDCFSGASGDMLLGSMLDAGLDLADLEADLAHLAVGGYYLAAEHVTRHGLTGTHLQVRIDSGERPARTLPAIERIVGASDLPEQIKSRSLDVFRRIARVEAIIHGTTLEQIHFHEIGAVDSLVDIVGFACALERLGIDAVYCSPLALGNGTVQTEHGRLPAPAPATLALLAEVGAPTVPSPGGQDTAAGELLTPTGAALLTEFGIFARPAMAILAVGYGFGTKELPWANALRLWLGESLPAQGAPERDEVVLLDSNLDDATGELLGYVMQLLFDAGALDVWFTPIQMKKSRPATQISVLARPEDAEKLGALLLYETPTLGVRRRPVERYKASREMQQVDTPWGAVRIKVKMLGSTYVAASPEYDDCARLALEHGVPLSDIMAAACQVAESLKTAPARNSSHDSKV